MHRGRLRQKHLEMLLSRLLLHPRPKLQFETYTLDAKNAAYVLATAGYSYDDLMGKRVVDLGCGTGILAIGAMIMGASYAVGVDIDRDSIQIAKRNTSHLDVDVNYVVGDIEAIHKPFDTTLMNPPFGSWRRGADVRFLKKGLDVSAVTYSLHKRSPASRRFLTKIISSWGRSVDRIFELDLSLPPTFPFHQKKTYHVKADLYRITRDEVLSRS